MTLDPARPEKTRRGVWGGVAPPVGLGFEIPPAARVRVRPHYPELPVPGPRRDMGWVWDWVLGLGTAALPGIPRRGSKKGCSFGFGIGFWDWVIFP